MYKQITSKTHRYISVRKFASNYILKKFHDGDHKAHLRHIKHVELYLNFYRGLIEFATGISYKDFQKEYMFGFSDASKEELHELTGIKIACAGNYDIYCIPRKPENDRIYNYMVENLPCKFKILSKTFGTYTDHSTGTYFRDMYRTSDELKGKLK